MGCPERWMLNNKLGGVDSWIVGYKKKLDSRKAEILISEYIYFAERDTWIVFRLDSKIAE
jgi:hypothetical protein